MPFPIFINLARQMRVGAEGGNAKGTQAAHSKEVYCKNQSTDAPKNVLANNVTSDSNSTTTNMKS